MNYNDKTLEDRVGNLEHDSIVMNLKWTDHFTLFWQLFEQFGVKFVRRDDLSLEAKEVGMKNSLAAQNRIWNAFIIPEEKK